MQRIREIDWTAVAMGLPLGLAIGVSLDNVLFGIPIGLLFGIAFAAGRKKPADEDGSASEGRDRA
ncbi:hypothetical protein [Pseudonocardia sp. DLS-67]